MESSDGNFIPSCPSTYDAQPSKPDGQTDRCGDSYILPNFEGGMIKYWINTA